MNPRHFLFHSFDATRKNRERGRENDVWHIWPHDRIRFTRQTNRIINVAIEIPCLFIGTYERDDEIGISRDDGSSKLNEDGEDVLFNFKTIPNVSLPDPLNRHTLSG